ncbi:MAG: hypothetical protein HC834_00875 [Rhodospirillales bacterium]|nr:hypothetical protein [Rhodospirillales bacterium]
MLPDMAPDTDIASAAESIGRIFGLDQLEADLAQFGVNLAECLGCPSRRR